MSAHADKKPTILSKIWNGIFYAIFAFVVILALVYSFSVFSSKNGVTSMFGYIFTSVQSESMSGTFEVGDIIISKEVDVKDLKEGDVISFKYFEPTYSKTIIVTHRIIGKQDAKFITQGDVANKNNSVDNVEYVAAGDVIAKYTGKRIAGLGKVTDFLGSKEGFFIFILIPIFLFLFWQIYVFIVTLVDAKAISRKKTINDEAMRLAEEMVKQMKEDNNSQE